MLVYPYLLDKPTPFDSAAGSPLVKRWLSVEELAIYLGIKPDTVCKWIVRQKMPAHEVGRLWKFRWEEIDHWVESGVTGDPGP
jgi:excisionase family DNA binding protein